jgi:hypothetical protein
MRELIATELVHVYGAGKECPPDPCKKEKVWCDEHHKKHGKDHHKKDDCKKPEPVCPPHPCT